MQCSKCQQPLEDNAQSCPHCGAALQQVRSLSSFSYLPANTPPWPKTQTQTIREASPFQDALLNAPIEHQRSEKRPSRSPGAVTGLIALLVLTPLLGVGLTLSVLAANGRFDTVQPRATVSQTIKPLDQVSKTPTASAGNDTLPTPTSFQQSHTNTIGYAIKYPNIWTEESPQHATSSTFIQYHPQQAKGIILIVEQHSQAHSTQVKSTSEVNNANLSEIDSAYGGHQALSSSSTPHKVGGADWDQKDAMFQVTDQNGAQTTFHFTTIAVQHAHLYYDIVYFAPENRYQEAVQKYIDPMLASFQFV